ncbi:arginine--tRNA ligase [Candidatus Moduliflexota bacterium]
MKEDVASLLREAVARVAGEEGFEVNSDLPLQVEVCREEKFGDFSSNVAMELSSRLGKGGPRPRDLGEKLLAALPADSPLVERAEMAGPGFLNFFIRRERWLEALQEVLRLKDRYGLSDIGAGEKIQVEFVSANPTGPLHLGHGRGAAVGDILSRVLGATGYAVEREFYINDAGRQVEMLARSVLARCAELQGREGDFPEDGYRGEYVYDLAREALDEKGEWLFSAPEAEVISYLGEAAPARVLEWIRRDLEEFGVHFDTWFSEKSLYGDDRWEKVVEDLKGRDLLFHSEDALWFRSTRFGDDKDRVVVKNDGSRTYLASDILYHDDKFRRGFRRVIDIWGADHHGYVPRMEAVVQALGHPGDALDVRLVQLVSLSRGGKAVAMGKRQGEFTTLSEVVREVGKDAARFFFLMRRCESSLEFDLDLAKTRSAENPVFYVQYAHARISSIFRTRKESGLEDSGSEKTDLTPLVLPEEMSLVRKITIYPDVLVTCARLLDPHPLTQYIVALAGSFHSYYNKVRVITDDEALSRARLAMVQAVGIVIRNALGVMGIEAPEKM